jgi:hypothetical protein
VFRPRFSSNVGVLPALSNVPLRASEYWTEGRV